MAFRLASDLATSKKAKLPTDFKPVASSRLRYRIFASVILSRIELFFGHNTVEGTARISPILKVTEHLGTANVVIEVFFSSWRACPGGKAGFIRSI